MPDLSLDNQNSEAITPRINTEITREAYIHTHYFKAVLSDGRFAYGRAGERSWLELKEYLCIHTDIHMVGLYLQFRDHVVEIAVGDRDYFLTQSVSCWYGSDVSQYHYLAGYREGDFVKIDKYIVPELVYVSTEYRSIDDDTVKQGLIINV